MAAVAAQSMQRQYFFVCVICTIAAAIAAGSTPVAAVAVPSTQFGCVYLLVFCLLKSTKLSPIFKFIVYVIYSMYTYLYIYMCRCICVHGNSDFDDLKAPASTNIIFAKAMNFVCLVYSVR